MPYQVSTLAALQDSLAGRADGSIFWTPEEGRLALNEALRDWNLLTGHWRTTLILSTIAPVAGVPTVEYALGATLTYGMRIRVGSAPALIPTSIFELDYGRPSWRFETIAWSPPSFQ